MSSLLKIKEVCMNILKAQYKAQQAGKRYALVTAVANSGGGTVIPGKKLLVFEDGSTLGTIGGGEIEYEIIKRARGAIAKGSSTELVSVESADFLMESFGPDTTVVVMGAGHVGGAVLRAAKLLNFATVLIDNRPEEMIRDKVESADRFVSCDDYAEGLLSANIPDGAYYFCAAWSHEHDKKALGAALSKHAAYVGMVGSAEKIDRIFTALREEGVSDAKLEKVFAPVGLDICDGSPEEIGFAVVAEMLKIKNGGSGAHCREFKERFKM